MALETSIEPATQSVTSPPLCELHVHLEGCVDAAHRRRWRAPIHFPAPFNATPRNFDEFLQHLRYNFNFLHSVDAYVDAALSYARRSHTQGIVYAELQINLALLNSWKLDLVLVLDRINLALAALDGAPTLRFIVDLPWHISPRAFEPLSARASTLKALGVVGLSLGGDERLAHPKAWVKAFAQARRMGLKTACHAGETTGAGNAQRIVETLAPDRVTHAVTIGPWINRLGPYAPPVDVCLTSNRALGVIDDFSHHPLALWLGSGVPFTLSTDDPAVVQTDLATEYRIAATHFAGFAAYAEHLPRHWLAAAFDGVGARRALGQ
ncbi:MAG: adenosine deaminase [Candidatus Competibacterales bacterium]